MPPKSDSKDSKRVQQLNKTGFPPQPPQENLTFFCRLGPNQVLQLGRKHPLLIDVLSLKWPLKVAARGSECGAIVAVIACCSTCATVALRVSDRVNDGRSDSHHRALLSRIWDGRG